MKANVNARSGKIYKLPPHWVQGGSAYAETVTLIATVTIMQCVDQRVRWGVVVAKLVG